MTEEQVKGLQAGQKLFYKSIYLFPEEVVVKEIVNEPEIRVELTDNCYVPKKHFDLLFLNQKECALACEEELQDRLEFLKRQLETEK